ncbi:MAG TPA: zf-HC2 domain-containing protein [Blastocatellia bacterium]|nr:zf-HC2 domain-containing protein [Blastocatellia bacterium]
MVCEQCQELISDYIDGTLELGEQTKMEHHLADCEDCRAVRDDLLQVVHFSKQLPMHTPSSAVWARIESDIASEQPRSSWGRARAAWARVQNRYLRLSIPQLAAAAAALAIVVSIGVMVARQNTADFASQFAASQPEQAAPVSRNLLSNPQDAEAITQMEHRIDQLAETLEQRKVAWTPELRRAFDRNMIHVDQTLIECRHQLSNNPADKTSQDLMLNAYREKVRLLEGFEKY